MDHWRAEPIPLVLAFIDRINRGDVDGIAELLAEDYFLKVFDEPAEHGRDRGIAGWRGYASAFPHYLIYP
jgi:ketosteroid isomerase-like protein